MGARTDSERALIRRAILRRSFADLARGKNKQLNAKGSAVETQGARGAITALKHVIA